MLSRSRVLGAIRAFERRSLRLLGVIGLLLLALGVVLDPTEADGAATVSVATSLVASVIVAAFALEREAFAQALMDLGVDRMFRDRKKDFDDDFWTLLADSSREHYRVLGTANHGYWHDEQTRQDTERTLRDAIVKRKVDVELLFLKPDGQFCARRGTEEQRDTVRDVLVSINNFWKLREALPVEHRERLVLKEYDVTPSCGITWADDTLVVTHYLAGRNNLGSPGLLLRAGRAKIDTLFRPVSGAGAPAPLTEVYIRNYKEIASTAKSSRIDSDRIDDIRDQLASAPDEGSVSEADLRGKDEE